MQNNEWLFIINPVAGNGYAKNLSSQIEKMAKKHGINALLAFTESRGHASRLAQEYASRGVKHIIAVGGDGTFNEIASGLLNEKDIKLGIVPAGTGNDFIQILGFPNRFEEEHWELLFQEKTRPMDVGKCNDLTFMNGMGLGFDAQVASENYTEPGEVKKGGKNKYLYQIIKTLLFYKEKKMTVLSSEGREETDCFINTIAIGRRFAGDFFLTPEAIADDGLLDVCMIKKLSLLQRFNILMKVPKGSHIQDNKVNYYQTPKIDIEFEQDVPFHLDGELHFGRKFDINILPKALEVIYNPSGSHFFAKE